MRIKAFLLSSVLLLSLTTACKRSGSSSGAEVAYVSAPQAFLRDHVSTVYNKVGMVTNGERVEVLGREKRFVHVKTASGVEGWVEQRYLVDATVYDKLQQLASEYAKVPAQAHATARNDVNMHVTPARDSDRLFQLKEGEKVDLLKRAITPKNGLPQPKAPAATLAKSEKTAQSRKGVKAPDHPVVKQSPAAPTEEPVSKADAAEAAAQQGPLEDWWLVRDSKHRVGWVLGRMLDVDVPMDIAQYAEGKRIVAAFVLTTVNDPESDKPNHEVPYYLVLMNENHDGEPQDFDSIRVFTWNLKKHRYETAYREHDVNGFLPVTVTKEDFGKDGTLPTFVIRTKDDSGALHDRKYRLEGVLVKRVYAPGEQPEPKQSKRANGARHQKRRR